MDATSGPATLGNFIATRLVEVGCTDFFCVPGDYNMSLLDQLNAEPGLNMIHCCNELNAGYAADGYARAKGVGCVVVTFTVGGLSVINAVAGAMSEHLPLICITGCPNSNDFGGDKILHHTIGEVDFSQELRCFKEVTCAQVTIRHAKTANEQVDFAISEALLRKKPVLIQVCSNMATEKSPLFSAQPVPYSLSPHVTNSSSLEAAVEAAADFLNKASKAVIVVGPQAKPYRAIEATVKLAKASQYATAVLPNAKGLFPETDPLFVGTYWGQVSSPYTAEVIDSAAANLMVGPLFNDYNTVAFSALISEEKMVKVDPFRVTVAGKKEFGCVNMGDFLDALREKLQPNPTVIDNYRRMFIPEAEPLTKGPEEPIKAAVLYHNVQEFLSSEHVVMADTGDCIFWTQRLRLPYGAGYESQMQYGSIGWSVGASLGFSVGARSKEKRLITFVGDGCFQIGAQDVSTMIRVGVNPVIFLLNNSSYAIEEMIHPGPYNKLSDWDYTALVTAMKAGSDNLFTAKVRTEEELKATLAAVEGEHKEKLCFIEVKLHPQDCSPQLLEWGARIAMYNSRPPQIH